MENLNLILAAVLLSLAIVVVSCKETPQPKANIQEQIALGEKVFQEKECAKCHSIAGAEVEMAAVKALEVEPPDLSSVFLAMDSLSIKKHLQFTELTAMPPIEMTAQEINAVTQYIANLHAKANADPDLTNADAACPICGAPVLKSEAESNHLKITYNDKDFYFECPDCKVVFERDPAWHSQSGHL